MFNKWSGENMGNALTGLADVRTDPYTINPMSVDIPSPKSVLSLPLKASLYMNTMRSGWAGFRYLYGLDNKFTDTSLRQQYRMTTVNGLVADTISAGKATVERFFRGETLSGAPRHYSKPWKIIGSAAREDKFARLSGTWEAGILDRFMLGKQGLVNAMNTMYDRGHISSDDLKGFIDDNSLLDDVIKRKYELNMKYVDHDSKYAMGKAKLKDIEKDLGFFHKRWSKTQNKMIAGLPVKRRVIREHGMTENAWRYEQDVENQIYKSAIKRQKVRIPNGTTRYNEMMKTKVASFGDLFRDKVSRDQVALWGPETSSIRVMPIKASFPWNKAKYARQYNTTHEAVLQALKDKGISEAIAADAAHQTALTSVWRSKMIKMAKPYLTAAYVVPAIADAAIAVTRTINETLERSASTMRALTSMEFGSDNLMQSSRMASERQRAVSAIQNAQMNARYLLGNEATMYH